MISVFIHGSCVSRGTFDYAHADDVEKKFLVKEYIAKNSIFGLYANPVHLNDFAGVSDAHTLDWNTRMVFLDFEKRVLLEIQKNIADIFVIDLVDERLNRLELEEPNTVLTYSESFLRGNYIEKIGLHKNIGFDELTFYKAYAYLERYSRFLQEIYRPGQIFVVEAYPVMTYLDENDDLMVFDKRRIETAYRLTEQLEMYYDIIKECMPGCNFIRFPRNISATVKHKWGLSNVHYESRYYDYVLRQIIKQIPDYALDR